MKKLIKENYGISPLRKAYIEWLRYEWLQKLLFGRIIIKKK